MILRYGALVHMLARQEPRSSLNAYACACVNFACCSCILVLHLPRLMPLRCARLRRSGAKAHTSSWGAVVLLRKEGAPAAWRDRAAAPRNALAYILSACMQMHIERLSHLIASSCWAVPQCPPIRLARNRDTSSMHRMKPEASLVTKRLRSLSRGAGMTPCKHTGPCCTTFEHSKHAPLLPAEEVGFKISMATAPRPPPHLRSHTHIRCLPQAYLASFSFSIHLHTTMSQNVASSGKGAPQHSAGFHTSVRATKSVLFIGAGVLHPRADRCASTQPNIHVYSIPGL